MSGEVEICFATRTDEPQIIQFLAQHWRADHIFVSHPELLRWQHAAPDVPSDELTFVLARRSDTASNSAIIGLLGYLPFRRFDPAARFTELSLAIWKVRDDAGVPGLGLQLLKALQRRYSPALICAIGISAIVRPIYAVLGYTTGDMVHAALFAAAPTAAATTAVGVPQLARRPLPVDPGVDLQPVVGESLPREFTAAEIDALGSERLPRKSWQYVLNRYLRHPYYRYEVRTVAIDGRLRALFVWRRVAAPASDILRMVDVIGDPTVLSRCGAALRSLLASSRAEYLDLVAWGVPPEVLAAAGFVSTAEHHALVLPNYFEPFVPQNVRVSIAYLPSRDQAKQHVYLFRADSDQDRPNLLGGATAVEPKP